MVAVKGQKALSAGAWSSSDSGVYYIFPYSVWVSFEEKDKIQKYNEKYNEELKAHMDNIAMASPNNLLWQDILACIEFKRMRKLVPAPPLFYKVKDYAPTKPEYLPVDHLEFEDPAPGPWQTPSTQHASDTALLSSGLTPAQPSPDKSSSKRGAKDTLESTAKKYKSEPEDTDADPDVTAQTGLYTAEIFSAQVEEIAKVPATVKDNIPELLGHHTFTNPISAIRDALGVPEPTKGGRLLHILVSPKLKPITELHGTEFFDVWSQCFLCHVTLWKEGVYHRDVSPGNMMWYWKDGKLIGVLNHHDLSSLADDAGPRGNERTGTVPFMALELLTERGQRGEIKYLYHRNMESFMWVFIWICLRYRQGVLLRTGSRPLDEWVTLNAVSCGKRKFAFLYDLENYYPWDIDKHIGRFLLDCVRVLLQYFERQTAHYDQLLLQQISRRGATAQFNDDEPEDIDGFLHIFTSMPNWVKLTELSNPSQ